VIEAARGLPSEALQRQWLEYHCGLVCRPWLASFVADVLRGGEAAHAWRKEMGFVPAPSLGEQLRLDRAALLHAIGGFHGIRVVPNRKDWDAGISWIGAPVRVRRDADYRESTPADVAGIVRPVVESVQDEDVTVRRWIGTRIARIARCVPSAALTDIATLPSLPPLDDWSADARLALSALSREERECADDASTIPGFRGPDAWYRAA
jgi:hypothetical protein